MKRAWEPAVLSVNFWTGPAPVAGDGLETSTGRRYLIQRVMVKRDGSLKALHCVVLPKGEPVPGTLHPWSWSPRTRRSRR